jgi:alpha-N-arabinofuranosidase
MISYKNPIIPGFHPDPSICRVGEDYYLVTSSFEFFPGVPLFHSRDLIHWKQIGHVLTRKSQLLLDGCHTSGGIFAPTIRYHDGRFYMITTNVSNGGNFYVWTDDIRGEWSEPAWVAQPGIDPSLFFDDDGTVYFASTFGDENGPGIGQCTIDIETGEMLSKTRLIWRGTGGKCPEGPHMYKRGDVYYLMIAEGGTEYGHMETIARGPSPWGPFESCPHNPILTHKETHLDRVEFQALGHADIVDTPEGDSWIVFHGIRPSQFMLHHLGRETMLAPLEWDSDGWPLINGGRHIVPEMQASRLPKSFLPPASPARDSFDGGKLAPAWSFLRNPDMENYELFRRPGYLGLTAGVHSLDECASPTFLGRRQQHFNVRVQTSVDFLPEAENDRAGITVFHTNEHHYDLAVTRRNGVRVAVLRKRAGDMQTESAPVILPEKGDVLLRIDSTKLEYSFYAGTCEAELQLVGRGRTQLLSTECMVCTFTGCFIGLFAEGKGTAWFDYFEYSPESD